MSALLAARDADRAADLRLTNAMAEYEDTIEALYRADLAAIPGHLDRIAFLAATIASNGADWSGGMANIMNVRATLRCNAAVNLLTREMHGA